MIELPEHHYLSIVWIDEIRKLIQREFLGDKAWREPFMNYLLSSDEITLEWWCYSRQIAIYINSDGKKEYFKVWGTIIDTEMAGGQIASLDDFRNLWKWLHWVIPIKVGNDTNLQGQAE